MWPKRFVVETDGIKFYVCLRDDRAFIVDNGTYGTFNEANNHCARLNREWEN